MATQTALQKQTLSTVVPRDNFLRRVLWLDIASCTATSLLLTLGSTSVAEFLGITNQRVLNMMDGSTFIALVGLGLLAWTALLLVITMREKLDRRLVWLTIEGDIVWVAASALILLSGTPALTQLGGWAVLLVADVVGAMGALKYFGLRKMSRQTADQ